MAKTGLNAAVAWTQQLVNNALNGRLHIGSLFPAAPATTGMTAWRDGVVCSTNQGGSNSIPNDLQVKAATLLNLTVEAGHCVITRSGQGPYLGYLLTQGTVTLANADTTNPRIDLIVAQLVDTAIGDSVAGFTPSLSAPGGLVIVPVSGVASGSPVAPSLTAGQIPLAQIAVAANATTITSGNITDKRRSAITPSGARTQLPGDVAVTDNGAVSGELRHTVGAAFPDVRVWSGTNWKPLGVPVYANNTVRNNDLGSVGQYNGQIAVVDNMVTIAYGGAWYNVYPVSSAPSLQMRAVATQSIGSATFTTVNHDTEDTVDAYVNHDTVTNNSRFTVTVPGVYELSGGVAFASNATATRGGRWLKNGFEIPGSQTLVPATTGGLESQTPLRPIQVPAVATDYFEQQCYQNTGGALSTTTSCTMTVKWVRG